MKIQLSAKYIVLFLIFLTSLVYFQSNFYNLIYLDDNTLVYNKFAGLNLEEKVSFSFISNYLGGHYYRPVVLITFIFDSLLSGQSFFFYHFGNFILHLLTSILIFFIIKQFGYSILSSFFVSLLFVLTPIHINAVGWIAGRGDLLATFFSVTALLIFLTFLKNPKLYLLIIVSPLIFLAILSKEVAILVPLLFIILFFLERKEFLINKNSGSVIIMAFVVLTSYYLLRGIVLTEVHLDKFSFTAYSKNFWVLPETVSKFFIPTGIKALSKFESFTSISGIIILLILLILPSLIKSVNKIRYYFGLLWFVLLLLPGMVNRTMEQDGFYYWDCRSYLPLVGFTFMIAEIIRVIELKKHYKHYFILISFYFLILGFTTFTKVKLYENPITYWNSVKSDYPKNFLPYMGLYNYYNHTKDFNNAELQLEQAIKINPNDFSLRQNLSNFYIIHNKKQEAFLLLQDAFEKKVRNTELLIPTYLSLCVELQKISPIDELFRIYSSDEMIKMKIRDAVLNNIELLKEKGDNLEVRLLLKKIEEMK